MIHLKTRRFLFGLIAPVSRRFGLLHAYSSVRKKICGPSAIILMYHRVNSENPPWPSDIVSPREFEREIAYLRKTTEVVSLDFLVSKLTENKQLSRNMVAITFDDGYKDNYQFAYPILQKYECPATIFLTTGHIGSSDLFWWDKIRFAIWNTDMEEFEMEGIGKYCLNSNSKRLSAMEKIEVCLKYLTTGKKNHLIDTLLDVLKVDITPNFGEDLILSWDEILEMNLGGISFGVHTVSHPILTRLPLEEAKFEIIRSKKDIEERLGQPATSFSFPNGAFNAEIIKILKENGFSYAVTTIPKILANGLNPYLLGRIPTGWKIDTFKVSLSGIYPDLQTALRWMKRAGV